jgi:hypothetical protein
MDYSCILLMMKYLKMPIRRMGVGFIRPIEGHLVADREGVCSTQVETSSTQVHQASPEELTKAPT